jgi:tRNA threonylcarbamoyladenosine biosynthesis protein TsaE
MRVERTPEGLVAWAESEAQTDALGRALAAAAAPGTVIALVGPLGAGKTRLSRAVAEGLGADPSAIASPTFVLIHEYEARWPVYHFDTYRLRSLEEFEDLGVAEYFDAGGVCLIEWAERVRPVIPQDAWWITIATTEGGGRRFDLVLPDKPARTVAAILTQHAGSGSPDDEPT